MLQVSTQLTAVLCRWGGTPLQDAVSSRFQEMATVIRGLGGKMSDSFGAKELYTAAATGDVSTLHLLTKHAGVNVSILYNDSHKVCSTLTI